MLHWTPRDPDQSACDYVDRDSVGSYATANRMKLPLHSDNGTRKPCTCSEWQENKVNTRRQSDHFDLIWLGYAKLLCRIGCHWIKYGDVFWFKPSWQTIDLGDWLQQTLFICSETYKQWANITRLEMSLLGCKLSGIQLNSSMRLVVNKQRQTT